MLILAVVGRWKMEPYDDADFLKHFALNFLRDGVFAWNVSDGPVHGNTSQLRQLVVTVITAIDPPHTVALTRIVLALALGFAIVMLSRGLAVVLGYQRVISDSSSALYVRRDLMPAYRCKRKAAPSK